MSRIEKLDSARIKQEKIPYTQILNTVLQNLKDPLALAIWVYLISLPDDWRIYRKFLMEHFSVGRDKLSKALKLLADHKLLVYVQERDDKGVFGDSYIQIKAGYEFEQEIKKLSTGKPAALLKTRATDYPLSGKTAPTKEISLNKVNKKLESLSDDFEPNSEIKRIAEQRGVDLAASFEVFKIKKKKQKSTNWQEELKVWILNEKNTHKPSQPTKSEIRCTVPEFDRSDDSYKPSKPETVKKYMGDIKQKLRGMQGSNHDEGARLSARS